MVRVRVRVRVRMVISGAKREVGVLGTNERRFLLIKT
jgi:hypothetical protein